MAKVRVYELAKELGVESKTVLSMLKDMGEFVRSASSTVEAPVERRLKEKLASEPPPAQEDSKESAGRRSRRGARYRRARPHPFGPGRGASGCRHAAPPRRCAGDAAVPTAPTATGRTSGTAIATGSPQPTPAPRPGRAQGPRPSSRPPLGGERRAPLRGHGRVRIYRRTSWRPSWAASRHPAARE